MSTLAMNPIHLLVSLLKGCDMAARGILEMAQLVGTAFPPQGYARAGQDGAGIATGLKLGEEGIPDPTTGSQSPEPSSLRWSQVNVARTVGHRRRSPLLAGASVATCAPLVGALVPHQYRCQ